MLQNNWSTCETFFYRPRWYTTAEWRSS